MGMIFYSIFYGNIRWNIMGIYPPPVYGAFHWKIISNCRDFQASLITVSEGIRNRKWMMQQDTLWQ